MRRSILFAVWLAGSVAAAGAFGQGRYGASPPEDVELSTADNVRLKATFFPGTKGKETVPVVLLHPWKGGREDCQPLAAYLQAKGHAVLVPDLRGHGESTWKANYPQPLRAADVTPAALNAIVHGDMEALKLFLLQRHNHGELNVERLCVVGIEWGGWIAITWTAADWSWPTLGRGEYKQGQDVRGVVLVSPAGLEDIRKALQDPGVSQTIQPVALCIVVDSDNLPAVRKASKLVKRPSKRRRVPGGSGGGRGNRTLEKLPEGLPGVLKADDPGEFPLGELIARFIDTHSTSQSLAWKQRVKPP